MGPEEITHDIPNVGEDALRDLDEFVGNRAYDDDTTLVVMKWNGIDVRQMTGARAFASTEIPEA